MALCVNCGGDYDFYPLLQAGLQRRATPPVEVDPFCPDCGQQRRPICSDCGGRGYVVAEGVDLLREHCTHCGRRLRQAAHRRCARCGGRGRLGHLCSSWGSVSSWGSRPVNVLLVSASRTTTVAQRPKRSRVLVKIVA